MSNPYAKTNVTIASRGAARRVPLPEFRRGGALRGERMVASNGEFNANDKRDLINQILSLASSANEGQVVSSQRANAEEAVARQVELASAFSDKSTSAWAELGAAMAGEVSEMADREGFMRQMLFKFPTSQGNIIRFRVRNKKVIAIVATSPTHMRPRWLREKYVMPREFEIKSNVRIEQMEMITGPGDLMEEKFFEIQEAIMVEEDRTFKRALDMTVGVQNDLQYLAGGLTPSTLAVMQNQITRWGLPAMTVIMANDVMTDIIGSSQFASWFDPLSQAEIVMTGNIGTLMNMRIMTDFYREPILKVLDAGDMYILSSPEMTGTFTDRGPVTSVEVNSYPDGVNARGWFFTEILSLTLHNARAVVKGKRS